jgi:hypothetical protein
MPCRTHRSRIEGHIAPPSRIQPANSMPDRPGERRPAIRARCNREDRHERAPTLHPNLVSPVRPPAERDRPTAATDRGRRSRPARKRRDQRVRHRVPQRVIAGAVLSLEASERVEPRPVFRTRPHVCHRRVHARTEILCEFRSRSQTPRPDPIECRIPVPEHTAQAINRFPTARGPQRPW